MKQRFTKRVAIIVGASVLALSGGALAVAHGGGDPQEREAFLNDAAKRLDVSPQELTSALKEAAKARLDAAAKDGRLTQEQADAMKERIDQSDGLPFLGGPGRGGPGGPGFHRGGPPPGMEAAAKYLGLSEAELREQLFSGKSLADVAKAEDRSVDGLKDAMEKASRDDIAKAVEDKRLTQQQADRFLEDLESRIDEKVERSGGPGRGGHRHGPPMGPPPEGAPMPPPGDGDSTP